MSAPHSKHSHGTMNQLMMGFALAVVLTVVPFALVMAETEISKTVLVGIIMAFAAVQILVHLVYFLHVNTQSEQGWTVAAAVFAVIILVIVLVGSLWVMHNMNVNMMPSHSMMEMDQTGELSGMDMPANMTHQQD